MSANIASNRRARYDYSIVDTFECGIVLRGSEVKSLRLGHVQLADAYARVIDGEVWLDGVHIPPYSNAHGVGAHDPDRPRKLLLHAKEIERLRDEVARERYALVPWRSTSRTAGSRSSWGWARAAGSTDKRQAMAERDSKREMERALGRQRKGLE